MLSRCFLDFSVGVGAFVIGLSQISSFFSSKQNPREKHCQLRKCTPVDMIKKLVLLYT